MSARGPNKIGDKRRAALAKLHCAKRDLGFSDEEYRVLLKRLTGKLSAAELTDRELGRVLDELRGKGFRAPATTNRTGRPGEPQERLIEALWKDLVDMGVLDDPSPKALRRFVRKVAGVDSLKWADAPQMNKAIEALKAWRRREWEKHPELASSEGGR